MAQWTKNQAHMPKHLPAWTLRAISLASVDASRARSPTGGGARVAGIRSHAIPEAVDLGSHSAAVFANVARNAGMSVGFQGCCSVLFADLDGAKHFRLDVSLARYPKQAGHDAIQRYAGKPS
jgi:hypothetical protein